jgi:hypothetical protein
MVIDPARTRTRLTVAVDQYNVVRDDVQLHARLAGSYAVCFSDEVFDAGALLHVQAGRPGRSADAELTDNTLSMDLLLLDQCIARLRAAEPQARHWQARLVAHADPHAGGAERLLALKAFIDAALADAGIRLVDAGISEGPPLLLDFRPALRQLKCQPDAA